jgi:hypothetical protein
MSAAELHFITARMRSGALSKAARGDYRVPLPAGYVYDEAGSVVKDPSLEVQGAVNLFFETYRACGGANRTASSFAANGHKFPKCTGNGFYDRGVEWKELTPAQATCMARNPAYAGIYSYGKHQVERTVNGRKIRPKEPGKWHTIIEGHHEGYITIQEYERNLAFLKANDHHKHGAGPAREGCALLQGIAICGKCGAKMHTTYHEGNGQASHSYVCSASLKFGAAKTNCPGVYGANVDAAVVSEMLARLTPEAVMNAAQVQKEIDRRSESSSGYFAMKVEGAKFNAGLAKRRFVGVDPANRLVAFELERIWEKSLNDLASAEEDLRKHELSKKDAVTNGAVKKLLELPGAVAELWHGGKIAMQDKKRILRYIVKDVTLKKDGKLIKIGILFASGARCETQCLSPQLASEKYATPPAAIEFIKKASETQNSDVIAEKLNRIGLKTGTDKEFTALRVQKLMR